MTMMMMMVMVMVILTRVVWLYSRAGSPSVALSGLMARHAGCKFHIRE